MTNELNTNETRIRKKNEKQQYCIDDFLLFLRKFYSFHRNLPYYCLVILLFSL